MRAKTFLLSNLLIVCGMVSASIRAADTPTRETIEAHRVTRIPVFGKYALVKLPIKTGVTIWNPTAITTDEKGVVWVVNYVGEIYSLHDKDGDGLEDHAELFVQTKKQKLHSPTTLLWHKGELLVGTIKEIHAYKDSDGDFKADAESRTFFNDFPAAGNFQWTFALEKGPDGKVYVIFCTDYISSKKGPDPNFYRGSIVALSPDGKTAEVFASGIRFAYGMAFNQHGDLFFTDNNGGGNPAEELNFAEKGKFYGHDKEKYPDRETVDALVRLKHGFGSGGLTFNPVANDFDGTGGNLFMACWGPDGRWDRGSLLRFELTKRADGQYDAKEVVVSMEFPKIVDLTFGKNGDLYVAQFGKEGPSHRPSSRPYGDIYRMIYADWVEPSPVLDKMPFVQGDKEKGKALFDARCDICHYATPGRKRPKKLGPSLHEIGKMFSREEILRDINEPSKGIKTDYETVEVKTKDGQTIQGRRLWARGGVKLLVAGNQEVFTENKNVESQTMLETSLMPPGLLAGLSEQEIDDLLAYLKVRDTRKKAP